MLNEVLPTRTYEITFYRKEGGPENSSIPTFRRPMRSLDFLENRTAKSCTTELSFQSTTEI